MKHAEKWKNGAIRPAIALAASLLPAALLAAAHPPRPNIVFFMADDLGRELLGAYGGETHPTPHIDRLAAEGMRFDICYATPMCSPTRVMLMSGKYNFRNYDAWGEYRFETEPTIANGTRTDGGRPLLWRELCFSGVD